MSYLGGASQSDESVFTEGTSQVNPIAGEYNDAATTPASGEVAVARITPNRAVHVNVRNNSGTELATSANPLRVDPTGTTPQPVTGTFWQATQPVSAASLPLPTGAATSAKQPALGTAGTAASDVISIQGIASMTPVAVSGTFFQATQPVSGTVTGNQGTANTVGNAWPIKVTDGTNAVTVASLTNSKALAVEIVDGTGTQITSFGGGTQYADGTTQLTPTGTVALGKNASNVLHAVSLDSSGNLNVNVAAGGASGGTSSSYGSAFPATGTAIGASDGTNMQSLLVESSSNKNLRVGLYSGANEASVISGDTGQNMLAVSQARKEVLFSTTTAQAVASTDVSNYPWVSVQINAQGTGSQVQFQCSNDNSNWFFVFLQPSSGAGSSTGADIVLTTGIWSGPIWGRYFRLNVTGISAGTTSGVVEFFSHSQGSTGVAAFCTQAGTWNSNLSQVNGSTVSTAASGIQKVGLTDGTGNAIGSTSGALNVNIASGGGSGFSVADETAWTAGTTSMVPAGAVFNDTATALTSGQEGTLRSTNNRALHVNLRNSSATEIGTSSNPIQVTLANTGANSTAVNVSGTVTANAGTGTFTTSDSNAASQGSTTSGQKGFLELGAVTTAAPTYTTGQSSPLSLTTGGALRVDASAASVPVTGTFWQATQPISGTVTANAGTGTFGTSDANAQSQGSTTSGQKGFLELGAVSTSAPTYTNAQSSPLSLTTAGALRVDASATTQPVSLSSLPALTAGSANIGNVGQNGTWTVQPGNTANTTPWLMQVSPGTSGGWSVNSQTALSSTAVTVKASGGNLGGYMFYNPNSSVIYIQVWDASSVTVGTTAPTYVIPLPATSGANLSIVGGITHTTAIKAAATTTPTGSTAPSTALTGFFLFN